MPNEDIRATIEDTVKGLKKEEDNTIRAKISRAAQNSIPPQYKLFQDERKALIETQSDTSNLILPTEKGRFTVIFNREDYLENCMDRVNNGPY